MFSLSPFSTFISLSINMSFNLKSSFYFRFDKRLLSMHAPSLSPLSLSPHLLQLFEQYINSLRQCHHHPTSSPPKKCYVTCRSQDVHVYNPNRLILSKIIIYKSTCTLGEVWLSEPNQNQTLHIITNQS